MASEKREIEIALKSRGAETSADRLNAKVKGVGKSADVAESSLFKMSKVAAALGVALAGAGVATFFTQATSAALKFNQSISNLSAITGAVGDDLKFLRDTALQFGATTTLSATEAAEALKLVASAKPDLLSNAQALKEVTRQAVLLAEASGGTLALADAAAAVGKALNQFGEEADQAARFVNVLAAGAKFGSSEVLATSQALKEAGVAAASANVSFEETNAAIQVLAKNGIDGSQAGTALRNIFLKLDNDTNSKLRPSVVGLSQALANVNKLNEDGAAQVKRFGLENIVAAKSLLSSVSAIDDLTGKLTGTNTALEQASTNVDNLAGDVKALGSAYESLQIRVGSLADGELRQLTQATTEFIQALNGNQDALDNWSSTLTGIETIAVAVASIVSGRLVSSIYLSTSATIKDVQAKRAQDAATLKLLQSQQALAASQLNAAIQNQEAAKRHLANAANATIRANAINALAAANAKATAAQASLTVATNAYTAAATRAGFASRALSGAVGLLGGHVGVAVTAAAAIAYYVTQSDLAAPSTEKYSDKVGKLTKNLNEVEEAQGKVNTRLRENLKLGIERQLDELNKKLAEQEQLAIQAASSGKDIGSGFQVAQAQANNLRQEINKLKQSLFELKSGVSKEKILEGVFDSPQTGGEAGLGEFGVTGGSGGKKDSNKGGVTPEQKGKGAGDDFISRLQLETQQLQAELEVRRQLNAGFLTEKQANDALELQNILFNYEIKRQTILKQEFQTETLRQEALNELREQEIATVQSYQERLTAATRQGTEERNRLSLLEQNARIDNIRTGASSALSLLSAFGDQSFKTQKKFAIAEAIVNIASGVAKALNNPYPANLAFAAQVAAQGAGLLATIKSSNPSSSSAAVSAPASAPVSAAAPPSVENQNKSRIINITGLDGFDDDQPIPLTVGGLKSLLSSNEDVNIAINQGQQNAQRVGAI